MTDDVVDDGGSRIDVHRTSGSRRLLRRLGIGGAISVAWLILVTVAALSAPLLPLQSPTAIDPTAVRASPSFDHLLGGDALGRDVFARLVFGARASLLIGVGAVMLGLIVGGLLGLLAGFFRGPLDKCIAVVFDVLLAIPGLVLAVAFVSVMANSPGVSSARRLAVIVVALGLVSIPTLGRVARASALTWSTREFVLAARNIGANNARIITREVLPNALPSMLSIGLLAVAVVIVVEGGLSLLGVGVQLPTPSWGNMVAEGRTSLREAPHLVFVPCAAIFLTVLALNQLGDLVRSSLDVRESRL